MVLQAAMFATDFHTQRADQTCLSSTISSTSGMEILSDTCHSPLYAGGQPVKGNDRSLETSRVPSVVNDSILPSSSHRSVRLLPRRISASNLQAVWGKGARFSKGRDVLGFSVWRKGV